MKVTITGVQGNVRVYPVDFDWTFEEADLAKLHTGIRMGELLSELARGDVMATLAVAMVARSRAEPNFDPAAMKKEKIENIELDLELESEADQSEGGPLAEPVSGDEAIGPTK